jgi:SAM-dependent methyltransferase
VSVDPRAATGFGSGADAYERGRPTYPSAAIDRLAGEFGLNEASTVLDLAAGTGKLTRALIERAGRVIAVEPSPTMRSELRRQVPAADIRDGTAEAIPLDDASVDAVFVGQAFHWFRAAEALEEIARVLRPGGGLALMWNRARWQGRWVERFKALVEPSQTAAGSFPSGNDHWKEVLERDDRFGARHDVQFSRTHVTSLEDFLALVASWSWIANLPDGERADLLGEVRELVGDRDALELAYDTEVYWSWRT